MKLKKTKTKDGSYTYFNEKVKECYHSLTGAEEEAIKKYAEPTEIKKLAKKGKIRILDICFGIGYNTAAALDLALKTNKECEIDVMALELDPHIIEKIKEVNPKFWSYPLIKGMAKGDLSAKWNNVTIKLLLGDAKKTVDMLDGEFDVVFLDPFSYSRTPHMWSEEFMKQISKVVKTGGVLSTYSCATPIRINLVRAGFEVKDGPCVGRISPSTLAYKI